MKKNSLLLLVTAVLLATGVALLARTLLAPPKAPAPKPVAVEQPMAEVLVATRTIEPGEFIDSSTLVWKPTKDKPSRSLYYIRGRDSMDALFGATVREPIQPGESIRTSHIVRRGEPGFLAAVLEPGKRAVSIPTSRVESNYGLVSPGDRVDVILSLERDKQQRQSKGEDSVAPFLAAQTILKNARVLALNNATGTDPEVRDDDESTDPKKNDSKAVKAAKPIVSFETVTLEVDTAQAEKLAVAKEVGTLQLALRPIRVPAHDEPPVPDPTPVTTLSRTTDVYASQTQKEAPKVLAFRGTKKEVIGATAP